jgi:hypothetical protein
MGKKKVNFEKAKQRKRNKNWPVIAWVLVGSFIITIMIMMAMPEEKIEFVFSQNAGLWQAAPGTKAELAGDLIKLKRSQGDMFVVIPAIKIDADWYDVAEIELDLPVAYDTGYLLFTSPFSQRFDFNFRYDYDTGPANRLNKRCIDLKSHGAWQGIIRDIMIIPAATAGEAGIRSIRFIHSNPWTKIKAWWNGFARYSDPRLGSCFVMASPLFIKTGFSQLFVPFLWWLFAFCLAVVGIVYFFKLGDRITKYAILMFFTIFLLVWGLLDARNDIYYLKGIGRDISLYWGKSLDEKRGIVTGDPEFVEFMKYCDENIPMDARIFNLVSKFPRGTPSDYLNGTQFWFQMRPRLNGIYQFTEDFPEAYYIVYQTDPKVLRGVGNDQWLVNDFIALGNNEVIRQNVMLWNKLEDLELVKLKLDKDERPAKGDLEVQILSEDGERILATSTLTRVVTFESFFLKRFSEPIFKMDILAPYEKSRVMLQIKNTGNNGINIGYSTVLNPYTQGGRQSRNDGLFYQGKRLKGELALTTEYLIKNPILFKKYSEDAYIFKK